MICSIGDTSKGSLKIVKNRNSSTFSYPCESPNQCTFYQCKLQSGLYKLEVWGAQGGDSLCEGGRGGYSSGVLKLTKAETIFIHIGGQPSKAPGSSTYQTIYGGYNGGGGSIEPSNCNGGGGGTDIRISSNTLNHRVIVAGGGGGGGDRYSQYYAGAGGGTEGQSSGYGPTTNGGKQTSGGTGGYSSNGGTQGSFGQGGIHGGQSAGGGGGWYGGSTSSNDRGNTGGGGGSGYIFNSTSFKPSDFSLTSKYYLTNGTTIQGTKPFLSPTSSNENGHIGHGSCKITFLEYYPQFTQHLLKPTNVRNSLLFLLEITLFSHKKFH